MWTGGGQASPFNTFYQPVFYGTSTPSAMSAVADHALLCQQMLPDSYDAALAFSSTPSSSASSASSNNAMAAAIVPTNGATVSSTTATVSGGEATVSALKMEEVDASELKRFMPTAMMMYYNHPMMHNAAAAAAGLYPYQHTLPWRSMTAAGAASAALVSAVSSSTSDPTDSTATTTTTTLSANNVAAQKPSSSSGATSQSRSSSSSSGTVKSGGSCSRRHMLTIPPRSQVPCGPGTNNIRVRTEDKYRQVYSDQQRLELEKEFHTNKFINAERKAELSTMLELTE